MNKLLILSPDSDEYALLIQQRELPELSLLSCNTIDQGISRVSECNIILGQPAWVKSILRPAGRLKWVQSTFAGVEALCSKDLRKDYILTGVKGVFGPLMSEYVFAYILALERQLLETYTNQKTKQWRVIPYRGLQGLTLGICGLGSVGRQIAATGKHFKMRVLAFKRTPEAGPPLEKVYTGRALGEFLGQLDYLVITLPLTSQTEHLFNYETLSRMKPTAVLINAGRGRVVAQEDLAQALRQGLIRGAVLDVFEKEPLPEESPLWEMPNILITPHNAAVSFPEDIVAIFADNYRRFIKKEKLRHIIDFKRGY